MRLDNYTKEMMDENSFIDMSFIYLEDKGKDADLYEIIDKFKEAGDYKEEEIAVSYTHLTLPTILLV